MDQQRFGVVWAIGIFQPERLCGFGCARRLLSELARRGGERRFQHAIDNDVLAHVVVVADVADVEIWLAGLWSRSDRDVFPVTCLRAVYAEDAERVAVRVKAVDEWSVTGVVVSPVRARSLARGDEAATF